MTIISSTSCASASDYREKFQTSAQEITSSEIFLGSKSGVCRDASPSYYAQYYSELHTHTSYTRF
jgi:hypothetical protein